MAQVRARLPDSVWQALVTNQASLASMLDLHSALHHLLLLPAPPPNEGGLLSPLPPRTCASLPRPSWPCLCLPPAPLPLPAFLSEGLARAVVAAVNTRNRARKEECLLVRLQGGVGGGERRYREEDRWLRWQVRAGGLWGWLEGDTATYSLTVGVGEGGCVGDYRGEEGRMRGVEEQVSLAKEETGGRAELLFTENRMDCLHLLVSAVGQVVVLQLASVCRMEVNSRLNENLHKLVASKCY